MTVDVFSDWKRRISICRMCHQKCLKIALSFRAWLTASSEDLLEIWESAPQLVNANQRSLRTRVFSGLNGLNSLTIGPKFPFQGVFLIENALTGTSRLLENEHFFKQKAVLLYLETYLIMLCRPFFALDNDIAQEKVEKPKPGNLAKRCKRCIKACKEALIRAFLELCFVIHLLSQALSAMSVISSRSPQQIQWVFLRYDPEVSLERVKGQHFPRHPTDIGI